MNILEQSEALKNIPEQALVQEMQMPTGMAPQYLILTEIQRRKRIRDEFQRREAQDIPTVAEETVQAAGMPQAGVMQLAKNMAPQTSMGQNTGVANAAPRQPTMGMAEGGITRLREGGKVIRMGGAEFALFDDGEVYRIAPNGRRFKAPAGLAKGVREFAAQAELLQEPAQAEEITSRPQYTPTPPDQQVKLPAELSPVTSSPTAEEITQNYPELVTQPTQIAMEGVDTPASLEQIAAIKEKAALDAKIQQKLFPNIVSPNAIDISQLPPEETQETTSRLGRDLDADMGIGFDPMRTPTVSNAILQASMPEQATTASEKPEQLMGQYTLDDAIAAFQARDPSTEFYANRMGEQALLYEAMGRDDPLGMASQLAGLTTPRTDVRRSFTVSPKDDTFQWDELDAEGLPRNPEHTSFTQAIEGLTVPEDILAQVTRPEPATYSDPFLNPPASGAKTTAQLEQATYSDLLNPADLGAEMPVQQEETAQATDELMQFLASQKPRFQGGAVPGGSLPPTAALLEQGAQDLRQKSLSDIDASPPGVFSLAKAKADAEKQLSGLGATKYTMDGEEFFVLKTGNVVRLNEDLDAVPVTGGRAIEVIREAQRLGADLSKAPEGLTMPPVFPYLNRIPLPNEIPFGVYETDEQGNVIPGTLTTPEIDISNLETPEYVKAPTQALANLMGIVEGSANVTSLSEAKTSLAPSRKPAPETVVQPLLTTKEKEDVLSPLVAPDVELAEITTPEKVAAKTSEEVAAEQTKAAIQKAAQDRVAAEQASATKASQAASAQAGSLEARIADAIAKREKRAEQDKWLSLAYAGAVLAEGRPNSLEKAATAGLGYFQKSRAQQDKFDADMLGLQQRIDAYKARIAAAGSKPSSISAAGLNALQKSASDAAELARNNPTKANIANAKYTQALYDQAAALFATQQGIIVPPMGSGRNTQNVAD